MLQPFAVPTISSNLRATLTPLAHDLRILGSRTAYRYGRLGIQGFIDQFDNVLDDDLPLVAGCLYSVRIHRHILGAGDDKVVHLAQRDGFTDTVHAWTLPGVVLAHPDTPAARATTEAVFAATPHLRHLPSQSAHNLTRRIKDAIVAPQVARVVVGDGIAERLRKLHLPTFDQAAEQFGIVNDFVVAAQLAIVIAQSIQAVRVGRDDGFEAGFAERLHILFGEQLEQPLLADAPHIVPGVALALVEDAEIQPDLPENLRHCARDLLHTLVVRGEVAHEPQVLHRLLARILDLEGQTFCPFRPQAIRNAKRVAVLAQVGQSFLESGIHLALVEQAAPHLDDDRHMFDANRAGLHTGAAGGAGPQRLRFDHSTGYRPGIRQRAILLLTAREVALAEPAFEGELLIGMIAQIEDQVAWREGRAGDLGRAGGVTAPTLRAGIQVQQVFPGEVANFAVAGMSRGRFFRHRRQRHARFFIPEDQVRKVGQQMNRFGEGNVGDEGQRQRDMKPPDHAMGDGELLLRQAQPAIELRDGGADR